tara:strand:- start:2083 stop:3042 length:960 start_codon:yes stop_codon:yes gene_type:complete
MKKKISIIVGGTGQFGISLSKILLNKNHKVIITTRNTTRAKKKFNIKSKRLKIVKLDILQKKQIYLLIQKYNPYQIFYFAGQSSPSISFKKIKETYLSNVKGCLNFLNVICEKKVNCKFINASSSEIFAETKKKISLNSKKKPISPYGKSKLISFKKTKFYRDKKNVKAYNAIIFNSESIYRNQNYLIPKICMAAIKAYKYNKKTTFGNIDISREWNWCDEQVKYLLKFLNQKPQDFILSNGKSYSIRMMLSFAFKYFKLNYKNFVISDKNLFRKKDFNMKKSNSINCLKRNKISRVSKIYGTKIIYLIIKHYLNEKKY